MKTNLTQLPTNLEQFERFIKNPMDYATGSGICVDSGTAEIKGNSIVVSGFYTRYVEGMFDGNYEFTLQIPLVKLSGVRYVAFEHMVVKGLSRKLRNEDTHTFIEEMVSANVANWFEERFFNYNTGTYMLRVKPTAQPLDSRYIDIIEPKTGRSSYLTIDEQGYRVGGGLDHNAVFKPKTSSDAKRMIESLSVYA